MRRICDAWCVGERERDLREVRIIVYRVSCISQQCRDMSWYNRTRSKTVELGRYTQPKTHIEGSGVYFVKHVASRPNHPGW